ncbi:hypothetical protein GCM10027262_70140 [Nocardia tengchongensis]
MGGRARARLRRKMFEHDGPFPFHDQPGNSRPADRWRAGEKRISTGTDTDEHNGTVILRIDRTKATGNNGRIAVRQLTVEAW